MAPRQYTTHAIVLQNFDHGESDKIVTLFSQDLGRISCIAKGAKKSQKRFVNKLETFSFLNVTITEYAGRNLCFLNEAELLTPFLDLRKDIKLFTIASIIQEFLLQTIKEQEQEDNVFKLTLWALHQVSRHRSAKTILAIFLIRFFSEIGFKPELSCCINCGISVNEKTNNFNFHHSHGGLICQSCTPKQNSIALGTVMFLNSAQSNKLEKIHRLQPGELILRQSLSHLHQYGKNILQREIISWRIFKEVNA
ncbi:MAG: DNA repair protein RecO [Desulfotalea sp.]